MPYALGYWIGKRLVAVAAITGKRFAIRAIRVKIFWANSVYNSAIEKTEFVPPVLIEAALEQTVDCFVASLLAIQREANSMPDSAICRAVGAHQLLLFGCIP